MQPEKQLAKWLDELGRVSDEEGKLTRTFLSPAMRRANRTVATWMSAAGLAPREDAAGNLIGRLGGSTPKAKTLLLGSHLDTVRDAGRFDGAVGVLLPIAALAELRRRKVKLPFAVEVLGFSEEEGVRFSSAYLGSKAFTGTLGSADLRLRDAQGVSVLEALEHVNGRTFSLPRAAHHTKELLGYLEVHIEQGPLLEAKQLAVGVVSGIAGQTRCELRFRGKAGHAGTTPMVLRRDALAGAAEFVTHVERVAQALEPLVATVGTLTVRPGAPNVIPGEVVLSLDVRHPRDQERESALRDLMARARVIAKGRGLALTSEIKQQNGAVECSPLLTDLLDGSVRKVQGRSLSLVSGAGHDAVVMSALTSVAMLFVRCREGLSHHPDEYASPADLRMALAVVVDFLERLAHRESL